ncbi:MAG: hypothetical protein O2854_03475 [Chloroflexi bacterium]|nr:hypothetical protein [Chloroflexota bacterium]
MSEQPQFDKARFKASMARLNDIYLGIAKKANEASRGRCPYKNAKDRCTAKFGCRNQLFIDGVGQPGLCTGSDKLNYREAWEV